jgi:protein-arginine kinase
MADQFHFISLSFLSVEDRAKLLGQFLICPAMVQSVEDRAKLLTQFLICPAMIQG